MCDCVTRRRRRRAANTSRVSRDDWIMVQKNIGKEIKLEKFRFFFLSHIMYAREDTRPQLRYTITKSYTLDIYIYTPYIWLYLYIASVLCFNRLHTIWTIFLSTHPHLPIYKSLYIYVYFIIHICILYIGMYISMYIPLYIVTGCIWVNI